MIPNRTNATTPKTDPTIKKVWSEAFGTLSSPVVAFGGAATISVRPEGGFVGSGVAIWGGGLGLEGGGRTVTVRRESHC